MRIKANIKSKLSGFYIEFLSILLDMQKLTFPELLVFSCASLLPALPKLTSTFSCEGERSRKWNSRMRSQACRNERYTVSYCLCHFWSQSFVQCHKELQKRKGHLCVSQMQNWVTFTHLFFLFLHFFTLLQTCSLALKTNKNQYTSVTSVIVFQFLL